MLNEDSIPAGAWAQQNGETAPPVVHVFGLFHSGTNAIQAYLMQYFNVYVQPEKAGSGKIKIWPNA
eukprot:9557704-Prorocentrum_lima.AAC.1